MGFLTSTFCKELLRLTNLQGPLKASFSNQKKLLRRFLVALILLLFCVSIIPQVISDSDSGLIFASSIITTHSLSDMETEIRQFPIPTNNSGPNAIISAPNHTFWFVEFTAGKLGEFFGQNSSFKEFPIPENASIPSSLAIDGLGNIWFSDQSGSGSIWKFDPSARHFSQYSTLTKKSAPLFILVDSQNDIWFTETTANKIGELAYPGYQMVEYTLPSANSEPVEMAWSLDRTSIWITETQTGKIARFDLSSHSFVEYSPPSSLGLKNPVGIVVDDLGNVWVSEHGGSAVVELTLSNSTFKAFPTSVPTGSFPISAVATLAIDSQGRLWFVEHYANKVGRLDPTTDRIEEFQIPSSGLAYSVLNALDAQGNFWFTEFGANSIDEIPNNASSPVQTTMQFSQGKNTTSGNPIYVQVFVSNNLDVPQSITLGVTSSFSSTGSTSSQQIALNTTNLNLLPRGSAVVSAEITPNASLPSGIYSVGIIATSENTSTVGIAFISVKGQFSLVGWIASNYQILIIAVVIILGAMYASLSRGSKTKRSKIN
jgi:virginiamycin B lyase